MKLNYCPVTLPRRSRLSLKIVLTCVFLALGWVAYSHADYLEIRLDTRQNCMMLECQQSECTFSIQPCHVSLTARAMTFNPTSREQREGWGWKYLHTRRLGDGSDYIALAIRTNIVMTLVALLAFGVIWGPWPVWKQRAAVA